MAWELRDGAYWRPLMTGDEFNNVVEEVVFAQGAADLLAGQRFVCGYYVVSGELVVGERCIGPNTLLWIAAQRCCAGAGLLLWSGRVCADARARRGAARASSRRWQRALPLRRRRPV